MWENSTTGDGVQYWKDTAAAFEKATGVKVKVVAIQNEEMDGKLQTALNSGDAPDVFMARGGGKLAAVVKANQVMKLDGKLAKSTLDDMSWLDVGLPDRWRDLRRAHRSASRGLLLQPRPLQGGRHHVDARHDR